MEWCRCLYLTTVVMALACSPALGQGDSGTSDPSVTQTGDLPKENVRYFPGTFTIGESAPETFPKVRLTGFFQADSGWVSQDDANILAVGDVQDGGDFRRARLAAVGEVSENVGYQVEFDFGFPGRPSFMDVWLELKETQIPGRFRVGHFRQPLGLDALTSVKQLTFIERSLPFALAPFRQVGVMSYGHNDATGTTYALSGFRFPTDAYGGQIGDDGGYGVGGRFTKLVVDCQEAAQVHIGGSYALVDPANDAVQFRSQPEFFMSETGGSLTPIGVPSTVPPFVDTGAVATGNVNYFGAELLTTNGPFHMQTEYLAAHVSQPSHPAATFYGVSSQVGWILTGEHRGYQRTAGVLGGIEPHCDFNRQGWGAWEVAARWSLLDLTNGNVRGGELNNVTIGLNWYLNPHTKFQLNYVRAQLEDPGTGSSNADIVALRAHLDF